MNVLLVNSAYGEGGAAIAVENLHRGLVETGHGVAVALGQLPADPGPDLHLVPRGPHFAERVMRKLATEAGLNETGALGAWRMARAAWFRNADIVNFHNLHGGYFNYMSMPRLLRNKPGVLTLHDMWAFTGHCVYSFECERWRQGCGRCPDLDTYVPVKRDATRLATRFKRRAFVPRVSVVAISRWMELAARASLLAECPIYRIPNGIDLTAYRPEDPSASRARLGLPHDRRIVLYVAHQIGDPRKGLDLLAAALSALDPDLKRSVLVLVLGNAGSRELARIPAEHRHLGYVSDVPTKRAAYAAADVLAFPTRLDNLPLVLQEALACGTPAVSFNVGGVPDLVRDHETGYLAPAEDHAAFARLLARVLASAELRQSLGRESRAFAEREFALAVQARRYTALFEGILAERAARGHLEKIA